MGINAMVTKKYRDSTRTADQISYEWVRNEEQRNNGGTFLSTLLFGLLSTVLLVWQLITDIAISIAQHRSHYVEITSIFCSEIPRSLTTKRGEGLKGCLKISWQSS